MLKALDRGADLRLYDVATGKRHPLDDQALAKRHIGYLVTVEGDMMSKLLRVRSIAQAPEPKLLLLDEARPGAPPSTTSSTGSTRASGEAAHAEVATPGTRRAAPSATVGEPPDALDGTVTNVLGARGEELRRWLPSFADAIGVEISAGLGPGTVAEIDGALRAVYQTGRVVDFIVLIESAVSVAGGTVTGRTRSETSPSVRARFMVAGRPSAVEVTLTPRGLTIVARPN